MTSVRQFVDYESWSRHLYRPQPAWRRSGIQESAHGVLGSNSEPPLQANRHWELGRLMRALNKSQLFAENEPILLVRVPHIDFMCAATQSMLERAMFLYVGADEDQLIFDCARNGPQHPDIPQLFGTSQYQVSGLHAPSRMKTTVDVDSAYISDTIELNLLRRIVRNES